MICRIRWNLLYICLILAACHSVPSPIPQAGPSPIPQVGPSPIPQARLWSQSPSYLVPFYFSEERFADLEALIERYATAGEHNEDGRFYLYEGTTVLQNYLEQFAVISDPKTDEHFQHWRQKLPRSAFEPIAEAIYISAAAWHARGNGFASSVTPEGWKLFHERSEQAWRKIIEAKPGSAHLPCWYEQAIALGFDANASEGVLKQLLDEGLKRFPGYHPIYFSYMRRFAQRWGGSYQAADAFIRAQVVAKTNPDGEVLYARLYWNLDQYNGHDPHFFDESLVSWPRMRTAFEALMVQYPNGQWNKANFLMFACRAGDVATFVRVRQEVNPFEVGAASPQGYSLEICDARFIKNT